MKKLEDLEIKIFADGADKEGMLEMYKKPYIKGLTTNPTLMRKAGISDYESFAREIVREIPDRPISFEVFQMTSEKWSNRHVRFQSGAKTCMSKFR